MKKTFQVKIWPISCWNPQIQEGRRWGVKIQSISRRCMTPDSSRSLLLWPLFRKSVSIYPRSAPFTTPPFPQIMRSYFRVPFIYASCKMSNHSKLFKWFFAYSKPQSIAVIRLGHPEQSSRFCSLRETSFPVFLKCCPSSDPVTLNGQELPNSPEKCNRT